MARLVQHKMQFSARETCWKGRRPVSISSPELMPLCRNSDALHERKWSEWIGVRGDASFQYENQMLESHNPKTHTQYTMLRSDNPWTQSQIARSHRRDWYGGNIFFNEVQPRAYILGAWLQALLPINHIYNGIHRPPWPCCHPYQPPKSSHDSSGRALIFMGFRHASMTKTPSLTYQITTQVYV
jgi:hypothetical protein